MSPYPSWVTVPCLLAIAVWQTYGRAHPGDHSLPPLAADSSLRPEEGMGVLVDLAAYSRDRLLARAARVTRQAPPPG